MLTPPTLRPDRVEIGLALAAFVLVAIYAVAVVSNLNHATRPVVVGSMEGK